MKVRNVALPAHKKDKNKVVQPTKPIWQKKLEIVERANPLDSVASPFLLAVYQQQS